MRPVLPPGRAPNGGGRSPPRCTHPMGEETRRLAVVPTVYFFDFFGLAAAAGAGAGAGAGAAFASSAALAAFAS